MSKLEELLQKLCPNGIEYKKLGNAISIERGKRLVREQLVIDGKYPVFQNSLTPLGYHTNCNYPADTVYMIGAGAAGEIGFSSVDFWAADDCYPLVCGDDISSKYLYHVLLRLQPKIKSRVRKASIPRISRDSIAQLKIPVPPLEVQREVVRVLDRFTLFATELTTELAAEFTARKKQYEYYRNKLLKFDINVERLEIGEVCLLSAGGDVPKNAISKEKTNEYQIPIISNGIGDKGFYGYTNIYRINEPCVTVAARGAGVGYVTFRDYPFFPIIRLVSVIPSKKLNPKFLYYVMQRIKFEPTKGGIPQLTVPMISKYKIPVPNIEIQNRIVNVLDNFEAICTDLNIGLPAEIEARQKQYEYYRDLLLTFAEKGDMLLTDGRTDPIRAERD